jgi:cation diffusion facilitator family transporter
MASKKQNREKTRESNQVTLWGLVINLALGAVKVAAGICFGSKALLADGMHSLLDLISDAAVLIAIYWASQPEDETHHYGHHKFSSFAQLFIGCLIFAFAVGLVMSIFIGTPSHTTALSGITVVIAIISLLIKESLFWWTRAVALKIRSELIMANAWHHRSDSISSLAVAVALIAVWLGGPEWRILDDIVSAVLGSYLAIEAGKIIWKSSADLLDTAPRKEIVDDLREHILTIPGAIAYHDFRVRKTGDYYEVDLHLQIQPNLTIQEGHDIASKVRDTLRAAHPDVFRVMVHIEPATDRHLTQKGISDSGSL